MNVNDREEFAVTVEYVRGTILGYHLLETWRSKRHGGIARPGGLPPLVAYDPETGRRIYRAWPDADGKFRERENNLPSEIYDTEYEPHMQWYDNAGGSKFMARPSKIHRDPRTNEITWCEYNDESVKPGSFRYIDNTLPKLDFPY